MHVLHFYKTYTPDSHGGIEQFIFQLINSVRQYNIQSEVLFLSRDKKEQTIELKTHRAHRAYLDFQIASNGFSFSAFSRFSQLAAQADLIHYHFPWPFMDLVHFITRVKKPTVVTYHSDIVRQKYLLKFYQPFMHNFLRKINHIVATSPNYLQSSVVLACYKYKTSVIPIGLDEQTYPSLLPEKLQIWQKRFTRRFFLFIGSLRYYKGLHVLLKAVKSLDYPVVIVGSGPEESSLKVQASIMGLKHVHFVGLLPDEDKLALLKLAYAFILPSHLRSEAFGISLLEAAMFGKPLISCEMGTGTTFINKQNETGLVIPPENSEALCEALHYLWTHPEQALTMGNNARNRYLQHFTADKMAADYARLYQRLQVENSG
jgi:glycosyltransferase involved in cell wall biosynthesis